ncbi:MAG: 30S ribosomal protein S16 [bacterium]|nr:30S ribosomal protein S16 [bacterium]
MLKIRLQRVGRVHEPSFRLVLTDSKNSTKSGRFKEVLGSYDPRKSGDSLEADRIKYWLSQGAEPTDTIHNLLIKHGIISGKKINVSAKSKKAPPASVPLERDSGLATPSGSAMASAAKEDAITSTLAESEVGAPTEASE